MAKKALLGLAAAAAVLIGVFVTTGWPPTMPGSEGAIGAAKRHQAQQMTAQDVKLGDTKTQEFLQSDVVARLMADRSARAALTDPAGPRSAGCQGAAHSAERPRVEGGTRGFGGARVSGRRGGSDCDDGRQACRRYSPM